MNTRICACVCTCVCLQRATALYHESVPQWDIVYPMCFEGQSQSREGGMGQMLAGQETGDVCLEVKREARMNGLLPAASSP